MPIQTLLHVLSSQRLAFDAARQRYNRRLAPDFNVFDFLAPDELRLSSILAWLLSPTASHGQGTLFLAEFLHELELDWPIDGLEGARVDIEVGTPERRRVDLVVRMTGAVLGIENKPFAADQPNQVADYLVWLDREAPERRRCLVYLAGTLGGIPSEGSIAAAALVDRHAAQQFRATSYPALLPWLARCRGLCGADSVASFIDAMMRYIRSQFMGVRDMTEREQLVKTVRQSSDNLRSALQVIKAASDIRSSVLSTLEDQIRSTLPNGYDLLSYNMSEKQYSNVQIAMPGIQGICFSIEFQAGDHHWLIYGAKVRGGDFDLETRTRLDAAFGLGRRVSEHWPWHRRAELTEHIFPVAGDWRTSEQPWIEMAEGTLAQKIVDAAQAFREVLTAAGGGTASMEQLHSR
jgi:hypothetical protein